VTFGLSGSPCLVLIPLIAVSDNEDNEISDDNGGSGNEDASDNDEGLLQGAVGKTSNGAGSGGGAASSSSSAASGVACFRLQRSENQGVVQYQFNRLSDVLNPEWTQSPSLDLVKAVSGSTGLPQLLVFSASVEGFPFKMSEPTKHTRSTTSAKSTLAVVPATAGTTESAERGRPESKRNSADRTSLRIASAATAETACVPTRSSGRRRRTAEADTLAVTRGPLPMAESKAAKTVSGHACQSRLAIRPSRCVLIVGEQQIAIDCSGPEDVLALIPVRKPSKSSGGNNRGHYLWFSTACDSISFAVFDDKDKTWKPERPMVVPQVQPVLDCCILCFAR
jgi:hypothetical protein